MLAKKKAFKWNILFHETTINTAIDPVTAIYLSPNAEEELTEFDPRFAEKSSAHHRRVVRQGQSQVRDTGEGREIGSDCEATSLVWLVRDERAEVSDRVAVWTH